MGRKAKNGRYVNVNISMDAFTLLEEHCRRSGQTKTTAIERAIQACYGNREEGEADAGTEKDQRVR